MVDLKSMSSKEKRQYIWDYYKIHIIVGIVIIGFIASIIHTYVTKVDTVFNMTVLSTITNENKRDEFQQKLTSLVVKPGEKRKQAYIDSISLDSSDDSMNYQLMQKFVAEIAANEIDVVVADKNMFDNLAKQGSFINLSSINGLDLKSIKNDKIEASGSDNNKAVYGISAAGNKTLSELGLDTQNKIICIISSSKHKDDAVKVINFLLNN